MTLPLTRDILRAAYDYLVETPPFNSWNLPDSDDIVFRVARSIEYRGWYIKKAGKHQIAVSSGCIGHTNSLMKVMAHEMLHLHQKLSGMESPHAQHNAAFNTLAKQICDVHGWDAKLF